jgi:hypothetical protein
MTPREIAKELTRTMNATLAAFRWPAKTLARTYGKGKWSGREILGHLTDCELVFLTRLQYMLAEENPTVVSFDQNLWAARFRYPKQDVAALRERFRALRTELIRLTKTASPADFARKASRPDHPDYTVEYLTAHAAEHNARHLEQLAAIKSGSTWTAPAPAAP